MDILNIFKSVQVADEASQGPLSVFLLGRKAGFLFKGIPTSLKKEKRI